MHGRVHAPWFEFYGSAYGAPKRSVLEGPQLINTSDSRYFVRNSMEYCENSPKYISTLNAENELEFHYRVYTALDIVDEKLAATGKTDSRELFLGLLHSTEDHKIYGYATNTKIKFIIVTESSNTSVRDNDVRTMFRKIHVAYTDVVCNPFYVPGEPITSKNFDRVIKNIMSGNA